MGVTGTKQGGQAAPATRCVASRCTVGCKGHHGIYSHGVVTGWPQGKHAYTGCVCKRVTVRQRCGEYGSKIALGFNHGKDQAQRGLGRASHNTVFTQKSLGCIFDTPQHAGTQKG